MKLYDKPNLTHDCDGPVLAPFTGICMTTTCTNFGDLKELPPGTLIFPKESPYFNGTNKNTFVCTYYDEKTNSLSGYSVEDNGKSLTPKKLYPDVVIASLRTENENLKNNIKKLAPFIGTTNFKNLVMPDNDLYLGKSFSAYDNTYVKTPVPGLYEVTDAKNPEDKHYKWLEKNEVKFLNETAPYGIIPSNKEYEPDSSSLEKFTAILSKAVQNKRIQDESYGFYDHMEDTISKDFSDYVSKNSHEEASSLLQDIISDNEDFYNVEALKSTNMNAHIYDGEEQLTGKINLVASNLGGHHLILPVSYSISEKDFDKYFNAYEPFDSSEMTGLEIESEQITAADYEIPSDNTEFKTSKENVTLFDMEYAFGKTFHMASIEKDGQVEYVMCALKSWIDKDPDNKDAIERFEKQMEISNSSSEPIADFLDLKNYNKMLNDRIIHTLNEYTKAHDSLSKTLIDRDIKYSPVLLNMQDEANGDDEEYINELIEPTERNDYEDYEY